MREHNNIIAPLFSIIVPTYNVEQYIEACIKSVINQNSDILYEIICIDDHSTDHTVRIISNLQKQYDTIKLIQKEKNRGVSDSRNIGIDQARGEYVLFLDGDDYIMPNTFSTCCKAMCQYNLDLLCFNAIGIAENNCFSFFNENTLYYLPKIEKGHPEYLAYVTNIWLLCYRRDFLIRSGIRFSNKKIFEDWEFLWNLYPKAGNVKFTKKALYVYRTTANVQSLTKQFDQGNHDFNLLIDAYLDSIKEMKRMGKYSQYEYVCLQRGCEIFYHFFIRRTSSYHILKEKMCIFSDFLHIPHPVVINKILSDTYFGFDYHIVNAIYRNTVGARILVFCFHGSKTGTNILNCWQAALGVAAPLKALKRWFGSIFTFTTNGFKAACKVCVNLCRKILHIK